ncbi:MAG: hypothetical protein OEM18_07375, partial [Nitrosopumilus sp.]|nr:hypothetical protein [Nitrosopumilus sp.]
MIKFSKFSHDNYHALKINKNFIITVYNQKIKVGCHCNICGVITLVAIIEFVGHENIRHVSIFWQQ